MLTSIDNEMPFHAENTVSAAQPTIGTQTISERRISVREQQALREAAKVARSDPEADARRDEALAELYRVTKAKIEANQASPPVRSLPDDQYRAYKAANARKQRALRKAAHQSGKALLCTEDIDRGFAEAAMVLLATGHPASAHILKLVEVSYPEMPGAPMQFARRAKTLVDRGKMRVIKPRTTKAET